MSKMRVKFISHSFGYEPGDVIDIEEDFARSLIRSGRARPTTLEITKKIDKSRDKMQRGNKNK